MWLVGGGGDEGPTSADECARREETASKLRSSRASSESETLAVAADVYQRKADNTLDRGTVSLQSESAMTTARARVPAQPTGLALACMIILTVVLILPL